MKCEPYGLPGSTLTCLCILFGTDPEHDTSWLPKPAVDEDLLGIRKVFLRCKALLVSTFGGSHGGGLPLPRRVKRMANVRY